MVPPQKPLVMAADGQPRFGHVEIEICSHCDCNCFGCDRFIDVAPTSPMTLGQIEHFVEESLSLEWEWRRIHILGGEPTLHPEFRDVVARFLRYKNVYPGVLLRIISNGTGNLKEHKEWLEAAGVRVAIEPKAPGALPTWFDNMRIAPRDSDSKMGPVPPCGIFGTLACGLGLTKHGYFLCGAGASIARVIGADIGVQRLADVTHAIMVKQAETLCNICGHWTGPTTDTLAQTGAVSGPFWTEALARYKQAPPKLSVYGEVDA